MITEQTIRERLAADQVKPCRTATWEEIEYLLKEVARLRAFERHLRATAARHGPGASLAATIREWDHR